MLKSKQYENNKDPMITIQDLIKKLKNPELSNDKLEAAIKEYADTFDINPSDDSIPVLFYAVEHSNVRAIKLLVEKFGADVNVKDSYGDTPLMVAALIRGNLKALEALLEANHIHIFGKNNDGMTALMIARSLQNVEAVDLLLRKYLEQPEFNMSFTDDDDIRLMLSAAFDGHCDIVDEVLSRKSHYINAADDRGTTPLMHAAQGSQFNMVALLLSKGADVNKKNSRGETALMLAASFGDAEVVKGLRLVEGILVNQPDNLGLTALHHWAEQNIDAVNALLSFRGIEVYAKDRNGRTPLHHAAKSGNLAVVEALAARGSDDDINITDKDGNTALAMAIAQGHMGVAQALREAGARGDSRVTPMWKEILKSTAALVVNVLTLGIPFIIATIQFFRAYRKQQNTSKLVSDVEQSEESVELEVSRLAVISLLRYKINETSLGKRGAPYQQDFVNSGVQEKYLSTVRKRFNI